MDNFNHLIKRQNFIDKPNGGNMKFLEKECLCDANPWTAKWLMIFNAQIISLLIDKVARDFIKLYMKVS